MVKNKRPPERDATKVIERMTKAVKNDETKAIDFCWKRGMQKTC